MGKISEFIDFTQKHKPQGNAVSGGIITLLISGMQLSWIFDNNFNKLAWAADRTSWQITIAAVVFYLSAIVGLFAAYTIINRITKNNIYVSKLKKQSYDSYLCHTYALLN
jgi:hypothetical protein